MLTINYGDNQTMYLEFCVTEPIETLFQKRAAFLVSHQQWEGITNWYNGLFADWNENDQVQNSPNNYDTISGFVIYEVASDDAGESRPAYLGEKESVYPVQSEVSALDLYITNFVWPPGSTGGLQRKTNETYSYGVYGIDNWYQLRQAGTLSLGRAYDYPHIVDMWLSMYKVAKYNPQITTAWAATNYLEAAWGTALALYTVAGAGNSTPGLMSEVVFLDLLTALQNEGMTSQYNQLLPYWESKVAFYATGNPNLFGSEYGFDSTGFEATQAFAKYALTHAGSDAAMGSANPVLFLQQASNFMFTEVTANMFDRGFLETAYYHYGSDFRAGGSDNFCLSYMTQMGGWGLLDYALNYATNFPDYLRLGYGSFLAGWGIMNTGTAASDYGFWYHGLNNDGACGGGYEPQAYFDTWLGQPAHRGPWYYSCEQNLGFCGAVREAATVLLRRNPSDQRQRHEHRSPGRHPPPLPRLARQRNLAPHARRRPLRLQPAAGPQFRFIGNHRADRKRQSGRAHCALASFRLCYRALHYRGQLRRGRLRDAERRPGHHHSTPRPSRCQHHTGNL